MRVQQKRVGELLFLKTFLVKGIFVRSSNFFLALFPICSKTFDRNRKWENPDTFFRYLQFNRHALHYLLVLHPKVSANRYIGESNHVCIKCMGLYGNTLRREISFTFQTYISQIIAFKRPSVMCDK